VNVINLSCCFFYAPLFPNPKKREQVVKQLGKQIYAAAFSSDSFLTSCMSNFVENVMRMREFVSSKNHSPPTPLTSHQCSVENRQ
jgi:hypothetical protein